MQHLKTARDHRNLTQNDLAERCGLRQSTLSRIESGHREPTFEEVCRLAKALDLPLEWFLTGSLRPGNALADIAQELRYLGMVDLRVTGERLPSAHRPTEEVMALAVGTETPEPRVIDALPALLAWNRWRPALMVAYAQAAHPRALTRLAWLADITLLIERTGGFPGGITGGEDLVNFLQRIERPHEDDHLGIPGAIQPEHRVWKYWRIDYPTDLQSFRDRALGLWNLRAEQPDA